MNVKADRLMNKKKQINPYIASDNICITEGKMGVNEGESWIEGQRMKREFGILGERNEDL